MNLESLVQTLENIEATEGQEVLEVTTAMWCG